MKERAVAPWNQHIVWLSKRQIFGAGGALIQKKNKEIEKGKGKEERREKRKKERGEFNLEDPMFLFNFHSFFQKIIK